MAVQPKQTIEMKFDRDGIRAMEKLTRAMNRYSDVLVEQMRREDEAKKEEEAKLREWKATMQQQTLASQKPTFDGD
jgi:hypothetical protein